MEEFLEKLSKEFLQQFINGKTLKDASKELNVHRDTMTKWVRKFNLTPTFSNGKSPKRNGKDIAVYALCFGISEAEKKFNKTTSQVKRSIYKYKKGFYA